MKNILLLVLLFVPLRYCFAVVDVNSIIKMYHDNYLDKEITYVDFTTNLLEFVKPTDPHGMNIRMLKFLRKEITVDANNQLIKESYDANEAKSIIPNYLYIRAINSDTTTLFNTKYPSATITKTTAKSVHGNEALECMGLFGGSKGEYTLENILKYGRNNITISSEPNLILGTTCYKLSVDAGKINIWFAPDYGMLPLQIEWYDFSSGEIIWTIYVQEVASIDTASGKWWYPKSALHFVNGQPHLGATTRLVTIKKIDPDYVTALETFVIPFPPNNNLS